MKPARWPASSLLAACCMAWPLAAPAQDESPDPAATPRPESSVRDPDFGVRARHVGLERLVEMYQWRERDGAYVREWNALPQDSSAFPPGHDNPPFPLQGRRWQAVRVTVDGVPLEPQVVERLGEWRDFRPGFNALPGNLAATFQPEGDGLGSAENPLAPRVGDLRIHWRELVLPPLQDRIELRGGRWRLRPDAVADPAQAMPLVPPGDGARKPVPWAILVLGLALVGLVLAGLTVLVQRRRR